jgi:hypothetical protein
MRAPADDSVYSRPYRVAYPNHWLNVFRPYPVGWITGYTQFG